MRGSNMREWSDVEVVFSSLLPRRWGTAFHGRLGKALGVGTLLIALAILGTHGLAAQALNLEDQKAIMQAQIELLHKEAELQSAMRQAHVGQALNLPQVVSIAWVAGRYIARLDLGQGVQGNFLQGERVQDELSIQSISQERVSVSWRRMLRKLGEVLLLPKRPYWGDSPTGCTSRRFPSSFWAHCQG